MKKITILTFAVAASLITATAQAALLSLYTFDNTGANAVATAPTGTLEGANGLPQYVTGKVGAGALQLDGVDDSMNITTGGFPQPNAWGATSNGLWSGSIAFWIKTTTAAAGDTTAPDIIKLRGGTPSSNDDTSFTVYVNTDNITGTGQVGQMALTVRSSQNHMLTMQLASADNGWRDGSWHQVLYTWNATTGATNTGSGAIYVDGTSKAVTLVNNAMRSSDSFVAYGYPGRIGAARSLAARCSRISRERSTIWPIGTHR